MCERFDMYRLANNSIYRLNESHWWKSYFVERNISVTKQRMYNCGRLLDMRDNHNEDMRIDLQGAVFPMILSDSSELIKRFGKWKYDEYNFGFRTVSMTTFLQKLLGGSKLEATKELELYKQHRLQYGKKEAKVYEQDPSIMLGLINGDKDLIKSGIEWLISKPVHHKRCTYDTFISKLISYPATAYLKAAWIKGYQVEVNSPLIPMDLMPVQPLEKYVVPYFFMDGFEGDYPDGWKEWKANEAINLLLKEASEIDSTFKWDKTRFASRQEAIIVGNALKKGYIVKKDKDGNSHIFNGDGQKVGVFTLKGKSE